MARRSWIDDLMDAVGQGRGGGRGAGGSANCTCPNCGHTMAHPRGTPCSSIKCPRCGTPMRGARC